MKRKRPHREPERRGWASEESEVADQNDIALRRMLNRAIGLGWICLVLSSVMLALSIVLAGKETGSEMHQVIWLTLARTVGIVSFVVGLIAIFNRRWTHGTLLISGSVFLPGISLLFHGSI